MIKSVVALIVIGVVFTSCGEPKQDRIQRLVDDKLHTERLRLEAKCRKQLLSDAIAKVDSIIIEKALRDTSARIIRPIRPDVPSLQIPDIDTLGIKPLVGEGE